MMPTRIYLSATIANQANEIQSMHAPDHGGWCGFCLRHHRIRVRAGECAPYQRAAAVILEYTRQQARRVRRPPRLTFTRPPT